MSNQDESSKTIRLQIPLEILEEDARRHKEAERILPSSKLGTRTKELAAISIQSAELKTLFNNLYDAALITDLAGHIVDANPRAVQYFYYTSQELSEGTITDIVLGLTEEVLKDVCQNLINDQFTLIQAFCVRKDGTRFPAEVSSARMNLTGNDYLCFFIRDTTKRHEAEEALKRAHTELEQQFKERTKLNEGLNVEIAERKRVEEQLYQAILQLQEHDKAKSEFVSNVSHELKTPVASINYAAGNILKGIAGPIAEPTAVYLKMIREDCQRLSKTVEDILDMSRIEADTLKLKKVKVNFVRFAQKTVESLRIQVEAAGLTMEVTMCNVIGFVECDPEKVERVIFNIIKNAIKYNNPNGFVNVELRYDEAGFFVLDVVDAGIGIPAKYLSRVTERFFRIGEHVSGAGLGLAISKEILERHGGSIELQSPPPGRDKGTLVSMRMPVTNSPIIVLLYEHEQNRLLMTRYLDEFGYNVISMKRGEDISQAVQGGAPDLIAVDWITPGMDGAVTISSIREQNALKYVPMIAIIGADTDPIKQEILNGLRLPVLRVPWQPDDLMHCLESAVLGTMRF